MSIDVFVLTEGGGGLFLCSIFYDRRINWENGKRKLFIFPGIHYIQLLTLLRERLRPENDWVCLMRDFEVTCLLCTGDITVRFMWQRTMLDREAVSPLFRELTLHWLLGGFGPFERQQPVVNISIFLMVASAKPKVSLHSSLYKPGTWTREEEGDNGRRYIENIVDRPMRTFKALWSLLETGKILSYPWMINTIISLVQLFTSISVNKCPSWSFCVMYLTFWSFSH